MDMRLISIMLALGAVALLNGGAPSLAAPNSAAKPTRDECIKMALDFLATVPMNDEVMARVIEVREFDEPGLSRSYVIPAQPLGCTILTARISRFNLEVPCFSDPEVMGSSDGVAGFELIGASNSYKLANEALKACLWGLRAIFDQEETRAFQLMLGLERE